MAAVRVPMSARQGRVLAPAKITRGTPAVQQAPILSRLRREGDLFRQSFSEATEMPKPTGVVLGLDTSRASGEKSPMVYVVYLVPSDKAVRADYKEGIERAIKELQRWYRVQMGNTKTFQIHSPTVEVRMTSHPAAWYAQNPNGDFVVSFWNNVVGDGFARTGGKFNDPNYRWVYYIDADPVCGQIGGAGTSGVTALPANDLRGLVGEQNIPPCANEVPDYGGVCRWIGGLGHELGHAFGLPHPAQCEPGNKSMNSMSCPSNTLMWFGYMTYPFTYLLEENKNFLKQGGFFDFALTTPSAPLCGQ